MEALAVHARRGQEGIGLLAHDRQEIVDRRGAVLALVGREVAEAAGDELGLVHHARADRARVDLDQADEVGILAAQELGDAGQHAAVAAQIAGARHRQMECRARCPWHSGCCTGPGASQTPRGANSTRTSLSGVGVHCPAYVAEESHSRVRHAQLARLGRLRPGVRIPGKREEFLLPQYQHPGHAAQGRRHRERARRPAQADRCRRGRGGAGQPVRQQPGSDHLRDELRAVAEEARAADGLLRRAPGNSQTADGSRGRRSASGTNGAWWMRSACWPAARTPQRFDSVDFNPGRLQGLQDWTEPAPTGRPLRSSRYASANSDTTGCRGPSRDGTLRVA